MLPILLLFAALTLYRSYTMSDALNRLTASVEALTTVDTSAVALISGLAAEIRDKADDSDALNALADKLDADATSLGAAVTANTPAAPVADPAPVTTDPAPVADTDAPTS